MYRSSSRRFLLEKSKKLRVKNQKKICEKRHSCPTKEKRRHYAHRTEKRQKITEIYFDEASPIITVATYNTDLKNRLTESYSEEHRKAAIEQAKKNGITV